MHECVAAIIRRDRAVLLCGTEGTISEDHLHHDRMVSAPRAKRTSSIGMVAPGFLILSKTNWMSLAWGAPMRPPLAGVAQSS